MSLKDKSRQLARQGKALYASVMGVEGHERYGELPENFRIAGDERFIRQVQAFYNTYKPSGDAPIEIHYGSVKRPLFGKPVYSSPSITLPTIFIVENFPDWLLSISIKIERLTPDDIWRQVAEDRAKLPEMKEKYLEAEAEWRAKGTHFYGPYLGAKQRYESYEWFCSLSDKDAYNLTLRAMDGPGSSSIFAKLPASAAYIRETADGPKCYLPDDLIQLLTLEKREDLWISRWGDTAEEGELTNHAQQFDNLRAAIDAYMKKHFPGFEIPATQR